MERAVRMVLESQVQYESQWAAIESISGKIGCTRETLRRWVRQAERDEGLRPRADDERATARQEARTRGARAAPDQRDPEAGERVVREGGARPPSQEVRAFIDAQRGHVGVEPICKALQVAPSSYWRQRRACAIRRSYRSEPGATLSWSIRSSGCTSPTCRSMALARSGDSCTARAWRWRAAQSSD